MAAHSVVDGTFLSYAFINGGGLCLRWFRDEITPELAGDPGACARLDEPAAAVPPGSDRLLWFRTSRAACSRRSRTCEAPGSG